MIDVKAMPFLADIPRHQANIRGEAVAIWFEDQETSYAQLDARSNHIANGLLAAGVKPQDRVAFLGKNMDVFYEILFGANKIRAAMAPMNNRLAAPELQFVLSDSQANVLFVARDYYELVESILPGCPSLKTVIAIDGGHSGWTDYASWRGGQDAADPKLPHEGNDDVLQLYTSGTTGLPKGVQLTNANFASFFEQAAALIWAHYEVGDPVLDAMPLFHIAGVNIGLLSFIQGAKAVILREIHPVHILDLIEQQKICHGFLVPAVILMLTQTPGVRERDFSSYKIMSYGASPIAESLLLEAADIFGCQFTQVYGLTETVGGGTYMLPEAHDPARGKLRSCGVPYPDTQIKCVDEAGHEVPQGEVGEILIKSGFVMKGYWNRPDATAAAVKDGWFRSGDAGYFDEDGFLYIHDRVKDMIVTGGENVYPAEVENALFGHPDIADVAVIGVPDEKWGEAVKAIIIPKPGTTPSEADIITYAKTRIAGYKCPKSVDVAEALPRNASGKVLRRQLREPYWEGVKRRVG
ncbi:long-chain-fatty-acid--CoA ligase [Hellea sp.]|nr:long-chain-fatty-acid--CoA ligase [Hellea sp.]